MVLIKILLAIFVVIVVAVGIFNVIFVGYSIDQLNYCSEGNMTLAPSNPQIKIIKRSEEAAFVQDLKTNKKCFGEIKLLIPLYNK